MDFFLKGQMANILDLQAICSLLQLLSSVITVQISHRQCMSEWELYLQSRAAILKLTKNITKKLMTNTMLNGKSLDTFSKKKTRNKMSTLAAS